MNRTEELEKEIKRMEKDMRRYNIDETDTIGKYLPYQVELAKARLDERIKCEQEFEMMCVECKIMDKAIKLCKDKNKHLHFDETCKSCEYELKEVIRDRLEIQKKEFLEKILNRLY